MQASESLIKAVVATAEVMGTELSADGARLFCNDLSDYPEQAVLKSLVRCRREVSGRLKLADVISRIDDGRPGAEEAWAMIPRTESETAVWTDEMRQAYGVASPLIAEGDNVAARMAFKQSYERLLSEARSNRLPVQWSVTLGHDIAGRESALTRAVELGRITHERATALLPHGSFGSVHRLGHEAEQVGDIAKRISHTAGLRALIAAPPEEEPPVVKPYNDTEHEPV